MSLLNPSRSPPSGGTLLRDDQRGMGSPKKSPPRKTLYTPPRQSSLSHQAVLTLPPLELDEDKPATTVARATAEAGVATAAPLPATATTACQPNSERKATAAAPSTSSRRRHSSVKRGLLGVSFEDLTYMAGRSNKTILEGISGWCPVGNIMAIMGPSGAGKSTLLDIVAGKEKRGQISVSFSDI